MIARTETPLGFRPRLVLAYADTVQAALASRIFRRQGWEVHLVGSGAEVSPIVHALAPRVVILDITLPDETGWLTCAKLLLERPEQRVILVGPHQRAHDPRFAEFVGAEAYVAQEAGLPALADEVLATALPV